MNILLRMHSIQHPDLMSAFGWGVYLSFSTMAPCRPPDGACCRSLPVNRYVESFLCAVPGVRKLDGFGQAPDLRIIACSGPPKTVKLSSPAPFD